MEELNHSLAIELAEILGAFRKDDSVPMKYQMNQEHVENWVCQFDEEYRNIILGNVTRPVLKLQSLPDTLMLASTAGMMCRWNLWKAFAKPVLKSGLWKRKIFLNIML